MAPIQTYQEVTPTPYVPSPTLTPTEAPYVNPFDMSPLGQTTTYTAPSTAPATDSGPILEEEPAAPSIDYDAIFNPVFAALDEQARVQQSGYQTGLSEAEAGTQSRKQNLQTELNLRQEDFKGQRAREEGRTESAIAAARRQASQLLQGIGAQFGGSTHLGTAAATILGAEATQNIAKNMAALQTTLGEISRAENEIKTKVTQLINQEDRDLEVTKQQLAQNLRESLAAIGTERGRLESEKAQMRLDAIQQYQQVLADVRARNIERKNAYAEQARQASSRLAAMKAQEQPKLMALLENPALKNYFAEQGLTPSPGTLDMAMRGERIPTNFSTDPRAGFLQAINPNIGTTSNLRGFAGETDLETGGQTTSGETTSEEIPPWMQ